MIGAIIGDICGSVYEWHPVKTTQCQLFASDAFFTDDSVHTIAVATAFMDTWGREDDDADLKYEAIGKMLRYYTLLYPGRGYGGSFLEWAMSANPKPYNSFGNGSAMRVSSVGWMFDSLEETLLMAQFSAAPTHNHEEGVAGAQATAGAIYLARTGHSKDVIRDFVQNQMDYNMNRTIAGIRPHYTYDVTCQGSVPESILAFLESESFEDCIRIAISLGGDADTQAAIAGSIAEAYYGVPDWMREKAVAMLDEPLRMQLDRFEKKYRKARHAFI